MKVVINSCFGGFDLSHKAIMLYAKLSGFELYPFTKKRDKNGKVDMKHFVECSPNDKEALSVYYSKKPLKNERYEDDSYFSIYNLDRADLILIQVIEKLKRKADGPCAELKIIEIPDGIEYTINESDGLESIHEKHRSWS